MSEEVVLYTTEGCSLCDAVLDQLLNEPAFVGRRLRVVDIALDEQLVAEFGADLPVLIFQDRELRAPFGRSEIADLLGDSCQ